MCAPLPYLISKRTKLLRLRFTTAKNSGTPFRGTHQRSWIAKNKRKDCVSSKPVSEVTTQERHLYHSLYYTTSKLGTSGKVGRRSRTSNTDQCVNWYLHRACVTKTNKPLHCSSGTPHHALGTENRAITTTWWGFPRVAACGGVTEPAGAAWQSSAFEFAKKWETAAAAGTHRMCN